MGFTNNCIDYGYVLVMLALSFMVFDSKIEIGNLYEPL